MLGQERAGEAMQAFAPSLAIVPAIRAGFNPDHRGPLEKQIVLFHSNRAREAKLSGNFSVSSPISVYQPAFLCQSVAHRQVRTVVSALSPSLVRLWPATAMACRASTASPTGGTTLACSCTPSISSS